MHLSDSQKTTSLYIIQFQNVENENIMSKHTHLVQGLRKHIQCQTIPHILVTFIDTKIVLPPFQNKSYVWSLDIICVTKQKVRLVKLLSNFVKRIGCCQKQCKCCC
jgi:hypothetical protein